jgi:acyl-CoA thioester hydrolase
LTAEPKVKISFEYVLYNDQDLLVGSATTTLAFLDKQSNKPIACPVNLLKVIQANL